MNIHQLLSATQSSPQTPSQGALGQQDSANGLFRQVFQHASVSQGTSTQAQAKESDFNASSLPLYAAVNGQPLSENLDIEKLTAALEALGIDISAGDLAAVLSKLQASQGEIPAATLMGEEGQAATPLDIIAERLALMATYSESSTSQKAEQPRESDALQLIYEQLKISGVELAQPIDPAALEAIAEQLNIHQTEAAQLVSALSTLVSQRQELTSTPAELARVVHTNVASAMPETAPRAQPDTFLGQYNSSALLSATSVAPQISSDALMGALLATEGSVKVNTGSEHLFTGFSLTGGNGPLASAQTAQGFAPTVAPTQASLTTPVANPAWPQQLSQQLVQISQRGGEQHVQMQLNPAELGPLSISLKFSEQGAQAHFLSAHAQVRQVLEQAIPQLREALAEQGISLGETSVGEQRDPNAQSFAQSGGHQAGEVASGEAVSDEGIAQVGEGAHLKLDGRVDLYA